MHLLKASLRPLLLQRVSGGAGRRAGVWAPGLRTPGPAAPTPTAGEVVTGLLQTLGPPRLSQGAGQGLPTSA